MPAALNPGGVITQWVPLYESSRDAVSSELATFFDAFPDGTIWGNDVEGGGYDVVLLGQAGPTVIDVDAIQRRLVRRDHADVAASLEEVGFGSVVNLFGTYAGRGPALRAWLAGAELNADRNLRLQYLAGTGLRHGDDARLIYAEILARRTFPDDLFVASDPYRQAIRQSMGDDPAGNAPAGGE